MIERENKDHYTQFGIDTFAKWEALPPQERERRVLFWLTPWYKKPYALVLNRGECLFDDGVVSEWSLLDNYLKKEYPIQFRVREVIEYLEMVYFYRARIAFIGFWHDWIIGQRKEMRKQVFRREYRDLDTIIVDFHMQCLIEFVERGDAFNTIDYTQTEEDKTFAKELLERYDYATRGRALLEKRIDEEYEKVRSSWNGDISIYKIVDGIQAQIEMQDTYTCCWVVKNRARLWT